ncbi:MAG: hypothetical protein ACYTFZ_05885 [Planctomycetota bacterium]
MHAGRFMGLLRDGLASRYLPAVMATMAVVVMLPALGQGRRLDDVIHQAQLSDPSPISQKLRDA